VAFRPPIARSLALSVYIFHKFEMQLLFQDLEFISVFYNSMNFNNIYEVYPFGKGPFLIELSAKY